jgi:hypothetical protein
MYIQSLHLDLTVTYQERITKLKHEFRTVRMKAGATLTEHKFSHAKHMVLSI